MGRFLENLQFMPQEMHPRDLYPGCCYSSRNYGGEEEISLIVKGNQFEAYAHSLVRGIPCRVVHQFVSETRLSINSFFHRQVQEWYLEDQNDEAPYRVGSVLYYATYIPPRRA